MPKYDDSNDAHRKLVDATKAVIQEWNRVCDSEEIISNTLNPNFGNLPSRRKKQQAALRKVSSYVEYERSCAEILGMEFDEEWLTGK